MVNNKYIAMIKDHYAENGFLNTFFFLLSKVLKNILSLFVKPRKFYVFEKELKEDLVYLKSKIDVKYSLVDPENLGSIGNLLLEGKNSYEIALERLSKGKKCLVCYHQSAAVGYFWFSSTRERDAKIGFTVSPNALETYGFDAFVLEKYRKYGIGAEFICLWLKHTKEEGKERGIAIVASYNAPMIYLHERLGFELARQFYSFEFFKFRGITLFNKAINK